MEKEKILQEKIDREKEKLGDMILKAITSHCNSHIYKVDLWGHQTCIFCGRSFR